jgi:hypothetical protein
MKKGRKRGQELSILPQVLRDTLTPVGIVGHGSGEAVLMVSPLAPQLMAFSTAEGGRVVLADLSGGVR